MTLYQVTIVVDAASAAEAANRFTVDDSAEYREDIIQMHVGPAVLGVPKIGKGYASGGVAPSTPYLGTPCATPVISSGTYVAGHDPNVTSWN